MHRIVYWQMARREVVVDDGQLARLRAAERRGETYVEFLDGERLTPTSDQGPDLWRVARQHDVHAV